MSGTTPTLAEFLLARIAEDESVARAATPGPWQMRPVVYGPKKHGYGDPHYGDVETATNRSDVVHHYMHEGGGASVPDATHIARHDPARVLAECAAKRRIVEDHAPTETTYARLNGEGRVIDPEPACRQCRDSIQDWRVTTYSGMENRIIAPCDTIRALASVYADHPDYRPAWA